MTGSRVEVTIDYEGLGQILKSPEMRGLVAGAAAALAEATGSPNARVHTYTTDRAAAAVTVPAAEQARDGVLTRAAAAVGLHVATKGGA